MEKNYVAPSIEKTAFHCPHCGTKAPQGWFNCYGDKINGTPGVCTVEDTKLAIENWKKEPKEKRPSDDTFKSWFRDAEEAESGGFVLKKHRESIYPDFRLQNIHFSVCQEVSCGKAALWIFNKIILPATFIEEPAHEDMSEKVKVVYNEALQVQPASPRAAAALLRLCCEMLCDELQAKGDTLNHKIADLVSKGLDERIQKALDIVRFIGSDSIHPGQIDLRDDLSTSHSLFVLVNEIVQEMISKPKRLDKIYNEKLPKNVREGIEKRNAKAKEKALV